MPVDEFHRAVAATALRAAARYGFALGGGNALIAYGIIDRPTQDVDLVTNREHGVRAAAGAVEQDVIGWKVCALGLLTELPGLNIPIWGQVSAPVTTVLGRELRRD
jgi:hypothetical protein